MDYIEIDGVKYKVDPNDSSKPLLDENGEKVLYEEPKPQDPPKPNPTPTPALPKWSEDMSEEDLDKLAEDDPALAKMIRENRKLKEDAEAREAEAAEEHRKQLEKNGEFKQLADEADAERKEAVREKNEAVALLDKYKSTVSMIRDKMFEQIPQEKQSLVPQGSARKQIEYILANAKHLGVSVIAKGSNVPKNNEEPPLDDEQKDRKRFQELLDKDELTRSESTEMSELSTKIKGYDAARNSS
tara:strand:- start:178 stop:906 length:729 start_codon:yes stop_codon:yes gene_type:complete